MIYTVFPKGCDEGCSHMPQDFSTMKEAVEYAETLDCDYDIESTEGEVV
ncbi:MAG: hypothetical protein K6G24_12200 [Lachnospiraceae bacterium]|nr:hypothetical protein [Lachnospiraceae bacterium]